MKKFLALYTGSAQAREKSGWDAMSESERSEKERAGREAWGRWMASNRAAILDAGGPLGKTRRASADGISDIRNNIVAYVTVQAASHEAAVMLFESHPHFTIFPGDSVEVMECLSIPGQ